MLKQPVTQVRLTNVAVVRLRKHGKRFEVACFRNKILNWRSGVETDINEVLQTEAIFENVSKGKLVSAKDLKCCFGTADTKMIARLILEKGELQVSDKEREAVMDALFKDIATLAAERLFNRRTGLAVSTSLVANALTTLGFSVAVDVNAKRQSLKAIELILRQMPDDFARTQMLLRIRCSPAQELQVKEFLPSVHGVFREAVVSLAGENNNINTDSNTEQPLSLKTCDVTFLCPPPYYRSVDQFVTRDLCPPGFLHVVSSREYVLNAYETPVPSPSETEPTEPQQAATQTKPSLEQNHDNASSHTLYCRTCGQIPFSSSADYRTHCRTEWHKFNVKRQFKQLSVVSEDEFSSLTDDVREGFLAVDS